MPDRRLAVLLALLLAASGLFLLWGLEDRTGFILELRAVKLGSLLVVGAAIGVSTVVFQTISGNRILTPAIMGFDTLFLLMQALLVFVFGGFGYASLEGPGKFLVESAVMVLAALALFAFLLKRGRYDMQRLILAGMIFGVLFRSLAEFLQRIIDPSEFATVQGAMFASFTAVDPRELAVAALASLTAFALLGRLAGALDVVGLGRETAIGLGLDYERLVAFLIGLVAVLVAVSTALVGPITFLGLLVSSFAHALVRSHRHALLLPAAGILSALVLVAGQALFERLLQLQSTLSVIIEGFGGLFFLYLVLRGSAR